MGEWLYDFIMDWGFYGIAALILVPIGLVWTILGLLFAATEPWFEARRKRKEIEARAAREVARARNASTSSPSSTCNGGYAGPTPRRGTYWVTGGAYDPALYYQRTHGYSRETLDYIHDAYGDWDTYEANRPD